MRTVTVIDYGLGNLFSVARAFEVHSAKVTITSDPAQIRKAEYLVLPGVGAFGDGIQRLQEKGFHEAIVDHQRTERPLLGICLGMQLLFESSDEFGMHDGLGLIAGAVRRIPAQNANSEPLRVPHVGWSPLFQPKDSVHNWSDSILRTTPEKSWVYFVHSYAALPSVADVLVAETRYGGNSITAVVQQGYISGCQFHPERSGPAGLNMLRAFLDQK